MSNVRLPIACFFAIAAVFPQGVLCQEGAAPSEKLTATFSKDNKAKLCNSDNRVRSTVLLGELGMVYQINLFALPDIPKDRDSAGLPRASAAGDKRNFTYSDSIEKRAVYWINVSNKIGLDLAKQVGIGNEHRALDDLKTELIRYAFWLSRQEEAPYQLAPDINLGDELNLSDRDRVVAIMLDPPVRPDAEPTAAITCLTEPKLKPESGSGTGDAKPDAEQKRPSSAQAALVFAVRGAIDALAVPRDGRSEAFKKTTDAKVAYTMNGVKKEESVAADVVVGIGMALAEDDAILGFVRYNESSTETDMPGDEDDAKDVRAVSTGILYRRPLELGDLFTQSGLAAYKTWDQAQDSQIVRIRAFMEDISLVVGKGPIFCGRESHVGLMYYSCRTSVFAEKGRVLSAGRSADFADITDDDYAGLGYEISLSTWLSGVKPLSKLLFTANYKKMWVVDGELRNPDRFMIELSYKLPNSDVSLGLSRAYGENFDTFQKEEVNLLSIGFKY